MEYPILLVGSGNPHKLAEIQACLWGLPVRVTGPGSLPVPVTPDESGDTFEENAERKALAFARAAAGLPLSRRPRWVIADDSGLCVEALGGAPGVHSARYAGEGRSDADNNRKLLEALREVEAARRQAVFVCVVACAVPGGAISGEGGGEGETLFIARGECRGRIIDVPRGAGGFGYDPLFLVPELGRTYAEMTGEEKNRLSHRGRALARVAERISGALGEPRGPVPGSSARAPVR